VAPPQQPEPQAKGPVRKKVQKAAPPKPAAPVEETEETVPVEYEVEAPKKRPPSLFEEALKEGVVKAPKQKASAKPVRSAGGITRDKEALARLLASF
jgi:heme-binding NEAT domain protein